MTFGNPVPRCPTNNSTYQKGCRCSFCRTEVGRRRNEYRQRQKAGAIDSLIPGRESRAAVRRAMSRGLSQQQVLEITGLSHYTISTLMRGKYVPRIRTSTAITIAEKLEDPEITATSPRTLVSSKKARQIINSLSAQGFAREHQRDILKNNLGVSGGFILSMGNGNNPKAYKGNVDHVMWLAEAVGERTGPSQTAATLSRNFGWFPLKHYNVKGDLIESTLSAEQRRYVKRVP